MRTIAAVVALVFAVPTPVRADPTDDLVREEMKRQKVPGLTLAVVKDGKVVKVEGYGLANVEHQVPAKRETVYQSGSVGKQFAAAAVLLLAEDGKLKLDDLISKHLPDVPEAWKAVTVRHLLTHTAGIAEYTFALDLTRNYTEDELLKKAYTFKLEFPPGEKWQYSNTGYAVLGILVSKVAGKFYGDFLGERVFSPLEMKSRIINEADIIPHRAAGYRFVKGELKNQEWVAPALNTTADGSLYVTVDDLIKWDAALTARKLFKKESYEAMWTPVKTKDGKEHPYGFGWMLGESNGHKRIHHGGAWQGFTSYIDRYPDDGLTVIVLMNAAPPMGLLAPGGQPHKVAEGVARLHVPDLAPKKKETEKEKK
jgi:CubicO group peptidase (beta-lactamase class C family)